MHSDNGIVLVIGASGGIGTAISKLLVKSGWSVIGMDTAAAPTDLFDNKLFTDVCIDVTEETAFEAAIERHVPKLGLSAVVYAAGVYDHFPLAEADNNRLERILSVNVLGFAHVVRLTFSRILAAKGRYIVVSSETALVSMPFQVYGMSKRMLEVYVDALYQELSVLGIPLITIRPGAHVTELLRKSRARLENYPSSSEFRPFLEAVKKRGQEVIDRGGADPIDVAKVVIMALESPKPKAYYHVNVAWYFRLLRVLPSAVVRFAFRVAIRNK